MSIFDFASTGCPDHYKVGSFSRNLKALDFFVEVTNKVSSLWYPNNIVLFYARASIVLEQNFNGCVVFLCCNLLQNFFSFSWATLQTRSITYRRKPFNILHIIKVVNCMLNVLVGIENVSCVMIGLYQKSVFTHWRTNF